MKDEIGGKIIYDFSALRQKLDSYLIDDGEKNREARGTKKWVIKRKH